MNERGLQTKSDYLGRQWDQSEFPILCESCLGDCPFVRMIRDAAGGTCRMCDRPYSIFRWRAGKGYKRTEVCQTCSKVKNICQSCVLDMQFALPSQLRDAVLSTCESMSVVPTSDANREFHMSQQIAAIESGDNPWHSRDNPNERLLRMAKLVASDRDQPLVKLKPQINDVTAVPTSAKRDHSNAFPEEEPLSGQSGDDSSATSIPLPPGITSLEELNRYMNSASDHPQKSESEKDVQNSNNNASIDKSTQKDSMLSTPAGAVPASGSGETKAGEKILPPRPPGPPPSWAFKNKNSKSTEGGVIVK